MKNQKYNNFELLLSAASELSMEAEIDAFLAIDTSDIEVDEHKMKRVQRLIRGKHTSRWHAVKIALVACLIIMSLAFTACMSIPELREAIYNVILEWREGHVGISFEDPSSPTSPPATNASVATTASPDESTTAAVTAPLVPVTPPSTIESKAQFTYLPEECYTVVEFNTEVTYMISIYTSYDNVWMFSLTQTIINGEALWSDNDYFIAHEIKINGCTAILLEDVENPSMYTLVWRDGFYDYHLYGCFDSRENIIRVAEGVSLNN